MRLRQDIVRAVQAACAQAGTCVDAFPYVGIGCAGTIDAKAGVVKYANNRVLRAMYRWRRRLRPL